MGRHTDALAIGDAVGERATYVQESHPPEYTRVYVGPYSKIAHLVYADQSHWGQLTLCGQEMRVWRDDWLGTGSQDEIDHAAELSLCVKCEGARRG